MWIMKKWPKCSKDFWQALYLMLKTVDFAEMVAQLPIKHKILQSSRFQIYLREDEVPVEKHDKTSLVRGKISKVTDYRSQLSHLVFRVL